MSFIFKLSLLFLFTIITIGCANANLHEHAPKKKAIETTGSGIVAGDVVPQLSVELKEKNIVLHYEIKNQTEHPVTYTFPTSQLFDYTITSKDGDVVRKYSDGLMFSQIVSTITMKQGESLTYNPVVSDLPKGTYLVTIWLTAKEDQFKTTTSFTIE
jgi:hypothetical protein